MQSVCSRSICELQCSGTQTHFSPYAGNLSGAADIRGQGLVTRLTLCYQKVTVTVHHVTALPSHCTNAHSSSHLVTKVLLAEDLTLLLKHTGLVTRGKKDAELSGTLAWSSVMVINFSWKFLAETSIKKDR